MYCIHCSYVAHVILTYINVLGQSVWTRYVQDVMCEGWWSGEDCEEVQDVMCEGWESGEDCKEVQDVMCEVGQWGVS